MRISDNVLENVERGIVSRTFLENWIATTNSFIWIYIQFAQRPSFEVNLKNFQFCSLEKYEYLTFLFLYVDFVFNVAC